LNFARHFQFKVAALPSPLRSSLLAPLSPQPPSKQQQQQQQQQQAAAALKQTFIKRFAFDVPYLKKNLNPSPPH
jgi:hypothetical protein